MKKQNWFIDLSHFIESRRHSPFIWGENDCCLFVADAIELITGIDAAAPYRNEDRLRYDVALAARLPIAIGVIEGACRHLINDRIDITGARC